jgi:type I restriction-modification system DNA methylase subunit
LRDIADENSLLKGIIDRVDFNATTHGVRDLDDDRLSNLIERVSEKRLGLNDVEPDIIGRSYEYLIRKFAEGSVSSAGEFYTPKEVGIVMARILDPEPGMTVYDPCCGSAGLLIKCQLALEEKMNLRSRKTYAPLQLYGQEYTPETWAMANMEHDHPRHAGPDRNRERARTVQEGFEDRQTSTEEALTELLKQIETNESRKKVQPATGLDGLTYFVLCKLTDEGVANAETASKKVRDAFAEFINWRESEKELRELRKKVTFAIFAEEDDLNKVTALVDTLFTVLQKAGSS